MTSETIDPAARDQILAAQNDEYEASTPGADAWRDRYTIRRPGSNPLAPAGQKPPPPPNPPAKRIQRYDAPMAQRHRFGRALDLPPAEPRDGIERGIIWAAVVSVALWGIFALIWWLT